MFPQKVGWKAQKAKAVTPRPKPRSIASRARSKELGKHGIRGRYRAILEKTGLRTPEYEEALAWTRNITVEQLREGYTKTPFLLGAPED